MKKNLLSKNMHQWLLLLVCFEATLPSWAEDYTRDGIIYDLNRSAKTATVKGLEDKSATSVEIRSYAAGCTVTGIGLSAFENCSSLTSINIPNSVTSIGLGAFDGCSALTSINIPSSVTSIEWGAFGGCSSLTSINIPSSVTFIGNFAFTGCSSLTSINIPSSVTSIGQGAFSGCSSLISINIPSSVTCIASWAFRDCSSLTSINIPSSVTSIEDATFQGCSSLTSINIPSSVTCIEYSAFAECSSLTSINIPSSVTRIGYNAFSGCSALKTIVIQSDRIKLGQSVFKNCGSIYAISDNLEIDLIDGGYESTRYQQGENVSGFLRGTWYTCVTPTISHYSHAVSSDLWTGSLLDKNTAQYLRTIFKTSTNAQTLISNNNAIYNNLSEDLRKDLEDNLQKVDDCASVIAASNDELSALSTNLSKAYENVRDAVYGQLGLSDLYKLYAQAEEITSPLNKISDYSPLLPTYTIGSNILTSADQLSTNKQETGEGPIRNLVDGDKNTYFHSTWDANNEDKAYAYLQIDLKGTQKDLLLDYTNAIILRATRVILSNSMCLLPIRPMTKKVGRIVDIATPCVITTITNKTDRPSCDWAVTTNISVYK